MCFCVWNVVDDIKKKSQRHTQKKKTKTKRWKISQCIDRNLRSSLMFGILYLYLSIYTTYITASRAQHFTAYHLPSNIFRLLLIIINIYSFFFIVDSDCSFTWSLIGWLFAAIILFVYSLSVEHIIKTYRNLCSVKRSNAEYILIITLRFNSFFQSLIVIFVWSSAIISTLYSSNLYIYSFQRFSLYSLRPQFVCCI